MSNGTVLPYLEDRIAKMERRIKKIQENPDPTKPKSETVEKSLFKQ